MIGTRGTRVFLVCDRCGGESAGVAVAFDKPDTDRVLARIAARGQGWTVDGKTNAARCPACLGTQQQITLKLVG